MFRWRRWRRRRRKAETTTREWNRLAFTASIARNNDTVNGGAGDDGLYLWSHVELESVICFSFLSHRQRTGTGNEDEVSVLDSTRIHRFWWFFLWNSSSNINRFLSPHHFNFWEEEHKQTVDCRQSKKNVLFFCFNFQLPLYYVCFFNLTLWHQQQGQESKRQWMKSFISFSFLTENENTLYNTYICKKLRRKWS